MNIPTFHATQLFIYLNRATIWSSNWNETCNCITITEHFTGWNVCIFINTVSVSTTLRTITVTTTKTYLLTCFGEHYLRYSTVIAEENLVKGPKQ